MTAIAGKDLKIYASPDNTTYTEVDGINSVDFKRMKELLDTSDFKGSSFVTRIQGLKDASASASGDYEPTDTLGAGEWESTYANDDTTWIGIAWNGITGHKVEVWVDDFSVKSTVKGKNEASISFKATGAVAAFTAP